MSDMTDNAALIGELSDWVIQLRDYAEDLSDEKQITEWEDAAHLLERAIDALSVQSRQREAAEDELRKVLTDPEFALATARADAFEEAALIAESRDFGSGGTASFHRWGAKQAAAAIRAAKEGTR